MRYVAAEAACENCSKRNYKQHDVVYMNASTGRVHWTIPRPSPSIPAAAAKQCRRRWSLKELITQGRRSANAVEASCKCKADRQADYNRQGCLGKRCLLSAHHARALAVGDVLQGRRQGYEERWQALRRTVPKWGGAHDSLVLHGGDGGGDASKEVSCFADGLADLKLFHAFFARPALLGGTFVEIGGQDGIEASNTLFYEMNLGWTGILIEPTPVGHCVLPYTRPGATTVNAGACLEPRELRPCDYQGTSGFCRREYCTERRRASVPCLPMSAHLSPLLARGVDLMSIDVENNHWHVLLSIPWEQLRIDVLVIECSGRKMCVGFMESKGYHCISSDVWADLVCVRKACLDV